MKRVITITTDFGDSFAIAQLHAVMASLKFAGKIIENHTVSPFSIAGGAFEIETLTRYCPKGSVHLGVVDPGVGGKRRGIIIKTTNFWFVGPDNGLLYPAARKDGIISAWQIQEKKVSNQISNTFHGRDIFIKAAVHLAKNKKVQDISQKITSKSLVKLTYSDGQVLHVDRYGNVKVYFRQELTPGNLLKIRKNGSTLKAPFVKTFSEVEPGKPLCYLGSSNTLELAINLGHAANEFEIKNGDILEIMYE